MKQTIGFLTLLAAVSAHADPRSSANFTISTETADHGGARATSTSYTNDGSAGGVAGISTASSPAQTVKNGYAGQLYDITGLTLTAAANTVDEGSTLQLGAWQALDDATFLAVPATSVAWSVASGPLSGISATGLATADVVYQDTAATAQGDFEGFTGLFDLTVLDSIADNFGSYAGDGLGDDWQVQHFGLDNPNAAPEVRTDGTGLTNLFKFTAGLIPNDKTSDFLFVIEPVAGEPDHKAILFGPTFADRTYEIHFSTDRNEWFTVTGPSPGSGGTRSFTDTVAAPRKFYRVKITKP